MAARKAIVTASTSVNGYPRRTAASRPPPFGRRAASVSRTAQPEPLTPAEQDACFDCFDTEDFRRGYAAFLAKAKPQFVGR